MTDYRRLEPGDRFAWGDELWHEQHWQLIGEPVPRLWSYWGWAMCGKEVGPYRIARRRVMLFNREPTLDEQAAIEPDGLPAPIPMLREVTYHPYPEGGQ